MKCSFCEGILKVTHSETVGQSKSQRLVCLECRKVHVMVGVMVPVEKRGDGHSAVVTKLKKGLQPRLT